MEKRSNNYHDYVIKDGQFIGQFENMYRDCSNPWPEDIKDLEGNPVSCYTVSLMRKYGFKKVLTVGSGKGLHANWIKTKVPGIQVGGCELSETAVKYSRSHYPDISVHCLDVADFGKRSWDFDLILFREVLWYMLPYWQGTADVLKKNYKGRHIIIELTFYDDQRYGREYFDGPEDLIKKFPFNIKEVLRHHTTALQRDGMILIFGEI